MQEKKLNSSIELRKPLVLNSFIDQVELDWLHELRSKKNDPNFFLSDSEVGHCNCDFSFNILLNKHEELKTKFCDWLSIFDRFQGEYPRRLIFQHLRGRGHEAPHIHVDTAMEHNSGIVRKDTIDGSIVLIPLSINSITQIGKDRESDLKTIVFEQRWWKDGRKFHRSRTRSHAHSIYDYSDLYLNTNKNFNKSIYEKYLKHVEYEDCHGMSVDMMYEWKLGSALVMDRTQLHVGSLLPIHFTAGKDWAVLLTSKKSIH